MTSRDLLRLLLRRWYLVLLGAFLSLVALWFTMQRPGVYWTEFDIVLLAPTYEYYPNQLEDPHHALAPLAGVLIADWNRDRRPLRMASTDTTLFGEGLRQGSELRLPNRGSQWLPVYSTPNIEVQVVDDDPEKVAAEAKKIGAEIDALLKQRQDNLGVVPTMRVSTMTAPAEPAVQYLSGSRPRTMGAVGLAGAVMTIVATHWVDRLLRRRRRSSTSAEPEEAPAEEPLANEEVDSHEKAGSYA